MTEIRYRPIDIDFEVYQLIVLEKRGFDEPDNEALQRLLGLVPGRKELPAKSGAPLRLCGSQLTEIGRHDSGQTGHRKEDRASWSGKGIVLPEGTKLRMTYGGIEHGGTVIGGKWEVGGGCYDSPSGAASAVAHTIRGVETRLNGWKYWHVKRPWDTAWVSLDRLRASTRG